MSKIKEIIEAIEKELFPGVFTVSEKVHYLNRDNDFGETAMMLAASKGQLQNVAKLIKHGANINSQDHNLNTPLMWALLKGQLAVADFLIQNGANLLVSNLQGETALIIACRKGYLDIAKAILEMDKNAHRHKDKTGNTALNHAAVNGHLETVRFLLESQAEIDVQNYFGSTALVLAADHGHTNIVKLLLDHNADARILDNQQKNALMHAAENGHTEVVRVLMQSNGVNIRNVSGHTAISLALANGHQDTANILIHAGQHK